MESNQAVEELNGEEGKIVTEEALEVIFEPVEDTKSTLTPNSQRNFDLGGSFIGTKVRGDE